MRTTFISLCITLLICSCIKPKLYQQRINDIPTSGPNFNTDIRFIGQDPPKNPHFKVIDIYLEEKGNLTKKQITKKLEYEAIKEGLDGIIEVESWKASEEVSNLFTIIIDVLEDDGETTTVTAYKTYMTGKGFIYLESLDDIDSKPEYEYVYHIDTKTQFPNPFFKIEYKLTGQEFMVYPESEKALDVYKKYFQFYSDFHLLHQREGWSYKMNGTNLKKRILYGENGLIEKICVPVYNDKNQLVELKIIHRSSKISKNEFVYYSYDQDGKIIGRIVGVYDGTKIYEDWEYQDDKLEGKKIFINTSHDGQFNLKTSFHYYDEDYLKDYYFNEVVKSEKK